MAAEKRSKHDIQFIVLDILKDKPTGILLTQLMRKSNLNGPALHNIIDDFIKRGLVIKTETTNYLHNKNRVVAPKVFYSLNLKHKITIMSVVKEYYNAVNLMEKSIFS